MRCVSGSRGLKTLLCVLIVATLQRGGDYRLLAAPTADTLLQNARFEGATGFSVSPSGVCYVLLGESDELLRVSDGESPGRRIGGYGWGGDGFDGPTDLSVPNDLEIYVSDYGNDRIVKLDRSLGVSSVFETTDEKSTFRFPLSICVTGKGDILVVDGEFGRIVEIDRDSRVSRIFGARGSGPGSLDTPVRVRTDGDSLIAVQDRSGLVFFDMFGNHLGRLSRSLTGEFDSFCWGGGLLALLDSDSVRFLNTSGDTQGVIPIPRGLLGEVVDMAVVREDLYLLTQTRIVKLDGAVSAVRMKGWRPD